MDVSVVIPVYNGAKVIGNQLKALALQKTTVHWEVIVSDNGSRDTTVQVVEAISRGFPVPLHIVDSSKKLGAAHARNMGVFKAQGSVIAFCDCDDYVADTWVQAAWDGIHRGADILGGEIRVSQYVREAPESKPWNISPDSSIKTSEFGLSVTTCNMVLKAEKIKALGGFDESLPPYGAEDSEICLRASKQGFVFMHQPNLNIYFAPTKGRLKLLKKVFSSGKAQVLVFRHHQDLYGQQWTLLPNILSIFQWVVLTPKNLKTLSRKQVLRGYVVRSGAIWGIINYSLKGWPQPQKFDFRQ